MSKTVSLDTLSPGEDARVIALRGGREFQHRIQSMGVSMGSELSVIQNNGDGEHGGIVIRVGDTRLMIGHGMASKVIVRPV
jgi:Fe2+ transport system protein FeoA